MNSIEKTVARVFRAVAVLATFVVAFPVLAVYAAYTMSGEDA